MGSLIRRLPVARALAALVFLGCGADQTKPGGGTDPSAPTITAVQPGNILATNLPQPVTIRGSGFDAPTVVLTSPAGDTTQLTGSQLSSASATSIAAQMTVGVAGGWRVLVRNGDGKATLPFSFNVGPAAPPTVQSISPTPLLTGTAVPQVATITGSGFQRGSTVLFTRGEVADFAVARGGPDSLSSTSLSFSLLSQGGHLDYDLFVVNPDGQMSASSVHFIGRQATPDPTIASITPTTIGISAAKQMVAFTGTGFETGISVLLTDPNGTNQSFVNATLQTPAPGTVRAFALLNVTGSWKYQLRNPDGGEADGTFNVGPPLPNQILPPAITGITPGNLVANDAEQLITIQGASFQSGLVASFALPNLGITDTGTVVSATPTGIQVKALLGQAGSWSVSLQNPDGAPSNIFNFTVAAAPPAPPAPITILSAQPASLALNFGSQALLINGTGFAPTSIVRVTLPAADLDVQTFENFFPQPLSRTQIRLNGVFDRAGIWHVEVDSASTRSNVFDIQVKTPSGSAPVVAGLTPAPFNSGLDQILHLSGSNFQPGLRLLVVGDDSSRSFSPLNFTIDSVTPTSARFVGRLHVSGRLQIQNPDGQVSNILRYTSVPVPLQCIPGSYYRSDSPQTIAMVCQSASPGITVVLTDPTGSPRAISDLAVGSPFGNSTSVSFKATLDSSGRWTATASNPDGQKAPSAFAVFTLPAPTLTGVPSSPLVASHTPQPVVIQGTGYQNGLTVRLIPEAVGVSGFPTTSFASTQITNLTPTSLQISPTLWLAGSYAVALTNPDGQAVQSTLIRVTGLAAPPSVSGVSPSTLPVSTPRLITVTGQDLEAAVGFTLTSPSGVSSSPSKSGVINRTSTQFQFYMGFDQPGTWKLAVRNVDNQVSNTITFTVQ